MKQLQLRDGVIQETAGYAKATGNVFHGKKGGHSDTRTSAAMSAMVERAEVTAGPLPAGRLSCF